eukprot:TRINITY_DN11887_c0_g1_i1.p2 TRINITY_DN11887_c0_g1~~TRINITY_DN11887_c0_g1_i1.p2  ORF type:complete len:211 (-),score=62.37 TRINITY_DN11887_c0_g1_i1:69-701(-)
MEGRDLVGEVVVSAYDNPRQLDLDRFTPLKPKGHDVYYFVSRAALQKMGFWKQLFDDEEEGGEGGAAALMMREVLEVDVSERALPYVIKFLEWHTGPDREYREVPAPLVGSLRPQLSDFDGQLLFDHLMPHENELDLLLEVADAASLLDIAELQNLVANGIASLIRDRSPLDIPKELFGLDWVPSEEELAQMREKEYPWLEQIFPPPTKP